MVGGANWCLKPGVRDLAPPSVFHEVDERQGRRTRGGSNNHANKQPCLGHRFGFDCCQAGKYSVLGQAIRHCKLITAGIGHRHAVTKIKKKKKCYFEFSYVMEALPERNSKVTPGANAPAEVVPGGSVNPQTNKQTNKQTKDDCI